MKNSIFAAIALLLSLTAAPLQAQVNIQLHYDLGHTLSTDELSTRPSVTTTIEMFHPDALGSTFFFVDLDYYSHGMSGAYWEVARELSLTKNGQWALHAEYDGGMSTAEDLSYANRFQQAVLLGGAWNWHSADFSRTFSIQAMYKYYFRGEHAYQRAFNSFQLTEVWGMSLLRGRVSFSGFCDLWYDATVRGNWICLAEPQLWYNFPIKKTGQCLSVGTEVEISNNFVWNDLGRNDKAYVIPTLAVKWKM